MAVEWALFWIYEQSRAIEIEKMLFLVLTSVCYLLLLLLELDVIVDVKSWSNILE